MGALKIFKYNETPITFQLGDTTMVNATEMAKPFNKRPVKWLELPSSQSFLQELSNIRKSDISDNQLIRTLQGSPENGGGTWFHEDVALEFARWLAPAFAIWCNDRIKELLLSGESVRTEKPGRYDASRNILPGIYSPETVLIGNHTIRTVHLDGILYYRLKDILIAAGVYERKKRDTSDTWFKPYVYWLNDQTGNKPKRYVTKEGILVILSKTRNTADNTKLPLFLNSFTVWTGKTKKAEAESDLKKFLNIIIGIQDDSSRHFLYDLYNKLSHSNF